MEKSIFGLWNKDGRFAIGSESIDVNKTFRTAFVLAHTVFMNNAEERHKEVMIDAFPIEQGNEFCRQFDLPDKTKYVELLCFDGNKAVPLKLFHLANVSAFDFDRCRYLTVQINTNKSRENIVRLRVFDANNRISLPPDLQHNIGWAMEYPYLDQPGSDHSHITQILPAELKVPATGEVVKVVPNDHGCHEETYDGEVQPETPAILQKILQNPKRNVSFLFPDVSTKDEIEGLSVFVLNRHLLAAVDWRKGEANKQGNINHTVEQAFITGFQKLLPVAEDLMKQLYSAENNLNEDEIDAQLNIFKCCLRNPDRHIDLMEAGDPSYDLKQEDQGYLLEIRFICPGDHIIFFDQRGRDIRVEGFLPVDDGSDTSTGIALLELCFNGFKLPEVNDRRKEEGYIELVRRNAVALPDGDGLQTKRSNFSEQFGKFLQHRSLFDIDHDLAPLLTFQFNPIEATVGSPPLNYEIVSDDIPAAMMATTLGGSVSRTGVRMQQPNELLLKRSLTILGFPDLLECEGDYRDAMKMADLLLHARIEDIQACGECLRDLRASELDFGNLASMVREYRRYFDSSNPLARYVKEEAQIVMPATELLDARELSEQLNRLKQFKEDLAPLVSDGATEDVIKGNEGESNLQSLELYQKVEQAISAVSREHDIETPLLKKLCDVKPLAQENREVARTILQLIRDHYPGIVDTDDKIVKELRRSLAEWASIPENYMTTHLMLETLSEPVNKNDLTEEAKATAKSARQSVAILIQSSFDGKEEFEKFSSLAANLTMSTQHSMVQEILDKCDELEVPVPITLRRQFAIWPRNCKSTWTKVLQFSSNSFSDSEEQQSFEPFDVSKAVEKAQDKEQAYEH